MSANEIVFLSVIAYIILCLVIFRIYKSMSFSGSDAAGNGMARGLTYLLGLGVLFLIAIVLTIINFFLFVATTPVWIKLLSFVPVLLPLAVFGYEYFGLSRLKLFPEKEVIHKITFEIRTKIKSDDLTLSLSTSRRRIAYKPAYQRTENGYNYYMYQSELYYESDRMFYIKTSGYETPQYPLKLPSTSQILPFNNWKILIGANENALDTVEIEFRYKVDG